MVANFRHGSTLFLVFIGAYLFCRGFFLHRNLSPRSSTCSDLELFHRIEPQSQCWSERRYKRLVVLVIDALKYDFTVTQEDSTAYWANRMPIFEKLRSQYPRQTFHARFIADSPTTTLQRLTALLTGSMPTFIDAATNFYQTSLNEDNIVRQMELNNLSVVFMGDDTWMSLLPDSFKRSYPYPSFAVHDLHTVDNGVLSHIYEELATNDADAVIGHFLGVDHCGHWYHQDHPEMGLKLSQMNQVVANVSQQLRSGDLLVVFGDHGMTLSGDHGGDTEAEKSAALFMYAPGPENLVKSYDFAVPETRVSQIDLVPSLSLLMGLPIPFSSLGLLIEPLFISRPLDGRDLVPLWINAQQVQRYVNTSSHLLKLIPHKVSQLNRLWDVLAVNFNDSLSANSLHRAATDYLTKVQTVARSAFTVFNIPFMGLGVVHLSVAALIATFGARKDVELSTTANARERSLYCWVVVIETAVLCLGQFSNSFIINEDQVSLFMLQGVLLMIAGANRNKWRRVIVFALMAIFRILSPLGWICRPEQGCQPHEEQPSNFWLVLAAAAVVVSVAVAHQYLRRSFGKSFSTSVSAQVICVVLIMASLSLLSFWFLQVQEPKKIQALGSCIDFLPNVAAVCLVLYQIVLICHRKLSKDRMILHLNYVFLHALGLWLLLCVYTMPRHVPSLFLHAACLLLMFLSRAVPGELEGALVAALMANTFFATGHQNTFQQIQWKSGFIGAAGSSLVVPGIRVILNTFSGHILTGFLLPSVMKKNISRSSLIAILVTKLTHQCVACFALRQHLMLWAVFATRLLFAIVEMMVMLLSVTLGVLMCKNSAYWTLGHMSLLENVTKQPQITNEPVSKKKNDRLKK